MPTQTNVAERTSRLITCTLCVAVVAFVITTYMGYSVFTALAFVAAPVLLLLLVLCFVKRERSDVDNVETHLPPGTPQPHATLDRPPSYRLTWRRSFIKRFKTRPTISYELSSQTEESPKLNDVSPKAEHNHSVRLPSATDNDLINVAVVPSAAEYLDDLPSYDQALEIAASRENLAEHHH